MSQQPISFALEGGLDRSTPAVKMPPGRCIAAQNYEPTAQGYKRIRGYERYDGDYAPSDQLYWRLPVSGAAGWTIAVGDNFNINGSPYKLLYKNHPTAPTIIVVWDTSGAGLGPNAGPITGTGGTPGTAPLDGDIDADVSSLAGTSYAALKAAAADYQRPSISALTGSGPVRGVFLHDGKVIAVRDNAGATAGVMYRASSAGWTALGSGRVFTFNSGGTTQLLVGFTVTGATSAATGTVSAITLTSGSWAAGDAAGSVTINVASGTFQNAENLNIPAVANIATLTNAGTAYAFPAGGSYEFLTHNFYGASNLTRLYGVNGVGQAFVFISSTNSVSPISTGMTVDTPTHLAEHNGALMLSFPGGSNQLSAVGDPLSFDPNLGATEIAVGSDVTALIPANKSTTAILAEESVSVLYGHDETDYLLETLTDEAGAIAKSAQRIGGVVYLDNGGLRSLSATASTGGFNFGSISMLIQPFLAAKRAVGTDPVCSFVLRQRNQYWLLFEDATGIVGCFSKKQPEFMPVTLSFTPTCACSVEIDGVERVFVGGSDGYVYEFDKGTSFDGVAISHYIELAWNHFGAPQVEKRGHRFNLDLETSGTTTLTATARFDNGETALDPATIVVTNGSGDLDSANVYIDGVFRNISMKIAGSTSNEEPHTLTGATYLISTRKLIPMTVALADLIFRNPEPEATRVRKLTDLLTHLRAASAVALDPTIVSLAAFNTNGFLVQTAADTFAGRTLAAPAAGLTITNPAGTAGNPTFALANDLAALEGLASTGLAVRSASDTWVQRSIAVGSSKLTVSNGDGAAGNPTLDLGTVLASAITNTPAGNIAATDVQAALNELDGEKLAASSYTAADVLSKLLTVDGAGSGLDADLLDGQSSAYFLARANHTGSQLASTISDFSTAADARISAALGVSVQAYDADLATWAGLTPSANAQSLVTAANYAAMRALLDLEAGTDFLSPAAIAAAYQPLDADLTTLGAGGTSARTFLGLGTGDSPTFGGLTSTGLVTTFGVDSTASQQTQLVLRGTSDGTNGTCIRIKHNGTNIRFIGDRTAFFGFGTGLLIANQDASDIYLQTNGNTVATASTAGFDVVNLLRCDSFRIDQDATAGTPVPTHTFTVSLNGTTYRIPCVV